MNREKGYGTRYDLGDLDGVLPSGTPSRLQSSERLLALGRAIELFEKDELQVTESVTAPAVTTQSSRYCRSSFRLLAGQTLLGKFGYTSVYKDV